MLFYSKRTAKQPSLVFSFLVCNKRLKTESRFFTPIYSVTPFVYGAYFNLFFPHQCCESTFVFPLTGSADKTVKFWDLETFELIGSAGPEVRLRLASIISVGFTCFEPKLQTISS